MESNRLTVPDPDDRGFVAMALAQSAHTIVCLAIRTANLSLLIDDGGRCIELLASLREGEAADEAKRVFGTVPDDEELGDALEELRRRIFGE